MAAGDKGSLTDPVAPKSAGAKLHQKKSISGSADQLTVFDKCVEEHATKHDAYPPNAHWMSSLRTGLIPGHLANAAGPSHPHPAARFDVQRRPRVAPIQHRAQRWPPLPKEPDNTTYWQVARAVVAAEPRATEAAATNAIVMGEVGNGDRRRGNGTRVVVGDTDDWDGGGGDHTRQRKCGLRRRGAGRGGAHGSDVPFCVSPNKRTEVARDRPTRLPQGAVISPKMPPSWACRPHIHRLHRLDH